MKHLKLLRKESGLTQEQLGEIFGLAGNRITGYERGERYPDIDVLKKMAKYFNVSVDYLIDLTESREPTGTILGITPEESELLNRSASIPDEYREAIKVLILKYPG